uniref:DUF4326 domain-containing protein n=1 Tax=Amycolatopsis sp. CA-290885 TaxID=3239925 RepID=UPI003F49A9E4
MNGQRATAAGGAAHPHNQLALDLGGRVVVPGQIPRGRRFQRSTSVVLPPHVVYVGRPTRYGNPHKCGRSRRERAAAVRKYCAYLLERPELIASVRLELAGRDLACWCALTDNACHAEVLLDLAANPDRPAIELLAAD